MRQTLYYIGGILLVIGAVLPLFLHDIAPWVFGIGALLFAPIQMLDRYEGRNLVIRHLRRQQVLGAVFLIITAIMLFMSTYQVKPFRGGEWKIGLLISVVFEAYTIFRIDAELKKEQKRTLRQ